MYKHLFALCFFFSIQNTLFSHRIPTKKNPHITHNANCRNYRAKQRHRNCPVIEENQNCNTFVTCNLHLKNSTDTIHGNIKKGNDIFIHNFGIKNTFVGKKSGNFESDGEGNSAFGEEALATQTMGNNNVAIGYQALGNFQSGDGNIALGAGAGNLLINGNNNIFIGNPGDVAQENNVIEIGNTNSEFTFLYGDVALLSGGLTLAGEGKDITLLGGGNIGILGGGDFITEGLVTCKAVMSPPAQNLALEVGEVTRSQRQSDDIFGVISKTIFNTIFGGGTPVVINSNGLVGAQVSSKRFKENIVSIKELGLIDHFIEKIVQLEPVRFNYKNDARTKESYGLIAESVEEILPELIHYDNEGIPYSVKYNELFTLLVLLCKRLHNKTQMLEETNSALIARIEKLEKALSRINQ